MATDLAHRLGLDAGYLSRILRGFVAKGYLRKAPARGDARRLQLTLTAAGRKAFAPLDRASHDEIAAMLAPDGERSSGETGRRDGHHRVAPR